MTETTPTPVTEKKGDAPVAAQPARSRSRRGPRKEGGRPPRKPRERSEFEQKIINIRRVTRVVAGGRRFSFSVAMVLGDKKGSVGVGIGKAGDTALAIEKAVRDAKKSMVKLALNKEDSIPHDVSAKFSSSEVKLFPAPGRGLIAGSAPRVVLELGGVKNVSAKLITRSKNHLNNARATVKALSMIRLSK